MTIFRVSRSQADLGTGPTIEAENPATAAALWAAENGMEDGQYWVVPVAQPVVADVTSSKTVIAQVGEDTAEVTIPEVPG